VSKTLSDKNHSYNIGMVAWTNKICH